MFVEIIKTWSTTPAGSNNLHWNPVTAGFVTEPEHWKLSSGTDYFTKEKGLLDLVILE